jgi:hypothetical protein
VRKDLAGVVPQAYWRNGKEIAGETLGKVTRVGVSGHWGLGSWVLGLGSWV